MKKSRKKSKRRIHKKGKKRAQKKDVRSFCSCCGKLYGPRVKGNLCPACQVLAHSEREKIKSKRPGNRQARIVSGGLPGLGKRQ